MACACVTPALVLGGVLAAEAVRTTTRCAGIGAKNNHGTEVATLAVASIFLALYFCLPAGLETFAMAGMVYSLMWCNKRHSPEEVVKEFAKDGAYREVNWREATADCPRTGGLYLVIGAGFVGKRLVQRLLERGERVRVMDICPNPYPADSKVEFFRGNALKEPDVEAAMNGVECVYATFAMLSFQNRLSFQWQAPYAVNVTGTEKVIAVAKRVGVKRIVQTSTSHVAVSPETVTTVMDETSPYVKREQSHNHYSWTKALSEQAMIAANGDKLQTVCIRPCSAIFGPSDVTVIDQMKGPVCPMIWPAVVSDFVFVDNVVLGHLKAEARLRDNSPGVDGEAFCISNGDPTTWEDLGRRVNHYSPRKCMMLIGLPSLIFFCASRVCEAITWATKGKITFGLFTPACIETAKMEFHADISKARKLLNYTPCWSLDEAVQQSLAEVEKRPDALSVYNLSTPRVSPASTEGPDSSVFRRLVTPGGRKSPDSADVDDITDEAVSANKSMSPPLM